MRYGLLVVLVFLSGCSFSRQDAKAGELLYQKHCADCHGADGLGAQAASAIDATLASHNDRQLMALIREGIPERSMPPIAMSDADSSRLLPYLRALQDRAKLPPPKTRITTIAGENLEGEVLNRGMDDMQLRTHDGRVHLLRRRDDDRYREVTSQADWPGYNGGPGGNRYTELNQVTKYNAAKLSLAWDFTPPGSNALEVTPVVVDGVMYVAGQNECFALDAGSGRQIWHYRHSRTRGVVRQAVYGPNRGVAVSGDRIFMVTDSAHIIALHRSNGALLWESEIADYRLNYFTTSAPLVAASLIVSGVAGGEHGAPGVLVAFDQATGKEAWRFRTVPGAGEPGFDTWEGNAIEHGGAPTWLTGSYDPEMETVFWPTGNPGPDYNGDARRGDNLYSDCILALNAKTGELKWYFQFTPHDLWDWDATETLVLIDTEWQGVPRKLLLQANRNGFFYVLDRTDGKMLLAQPFVRNLTWARGIQSNGRPILVAHQEPSTDGTRVCPSQSGATNWFSPSFLPSAGLFYVQSLEGCSIYNKTASDDWKPGTTYLGGSERVAGNGRSRRVLKAIDVHTGKIRWQRSQPAPEQSWGGTLATVTGLVVFGEESGKLMVVDALTGELLWDFPTGQIWRASPMAYSFDGQQHFAIAAGTRILSFTIRE